MACVKTGAAISADILLSNQGDGNNSLRDGGFLRGRIAILLLERAARALPGKRKIRKQERAKPNGLSAGIAETGAWGLKRYF